MTPTPVVDVCVSNLIQNWSFELPVVSGQNIQYWTEKPYEGSVVQGTGYQAEGKYTAFIGPSESLYQDVSVSVGQTYSLTFWSGTHDPIQNETIQLQFLNTAGTVIAAQTTNIDYDVDLHPNFPRLTRYTMQWVAPSGTVKARVRGQNDGNNTFKLDAVCLKGL